MVVVGKVSNDISFTNFVQRVRSGMTMSVLLKMIGGMQCCATGCEFPVL